MKTIIPIMTLLFLFFLISCKFNILSNHEINIKYREKNPIEIIKIDSIQGNIDVIGWQNDFIEINTRKILESGLTQDINLMDTVFEREKNELNIKTKIPARIDGKIYLKIYVPYILSKIYINSKNGSININNFLGDIELTNKNGNINIAFQGNILRIDSYRSKINLNIKTFNSSDIVINNEEGNTKVNIENIGKSSYLDVKSLNGDVNVYIFKELDHRLSVTNKDKNVSVKYDIYDKTIISGIYEFISGKKGKHFDDFLVDITNENGKINLSIADEKYFKKELSDLPLFN
jgi:hypothetical protein